MVCGLKDVMVHPYTVTPAKLAPDLGIQVHLRSENDATTSWLRLISPFRPLHASILDIYKVFKPILSQGSMGAPLYRYTGQAGPRLVIQRLLWIENDAITSWLRLIFMHLWLWLFHVSAHTALQHWEVLPRHVPIWRTDLPFFIKTLAGDLLQLIWKLRRIDSKSLIIDPT